MINNHIVIIVSIINVSICSVYYCYNNNPLMRIHNNIITMGMYSTFDCLS